MQVSLISRSLWWSIRPRIERVYIHLSAFDLYNFYNLHVILLFTYSISVDMAYALRNTRNNFIVWCAYHLIIIEKIIWSDIFLSKLPIYKTHNSSHKIGNTLTAWPNNMWTLATLHESLHSPHRAEQNHSTFTHKSSSRVNPKMLASLTTTPRNGEPADQCLAQPQHKHHSKCCQ